MNYDRDLAIQARLVSFALGWLSVLVLVLGSAGAIGLAWDAARDDTSAFFVVQILLGLLFSTFAAAGILGCASIAIRIGSDYAEAHLDRLAELAGAGEEEAEGVTRS